MVLKPLKPGPPGRRNQSIRIRNSEKGGHNGCKKTGTATATEKDR